MDEEQVPKTSTTRWMWVRRVVHAQDPMSTKRWWILEADGNGRPSHDPDDSVTIGGLGECPFKPGERLSVTLEASP